MKLAPLKQWYCDQCGNVIQNADDGYFEWKENDEGLNYGFRIVHFKACQYDERTFGADERVQDLQLDEYIGHDGMVRLLDILATRNLKDKNELLEVFSRLQLPYYEEARTYFEKALQDGYIEDIHDQGNKFSYNALEIIKKYA
ncbi:hypothetical protein ACFVS2_26740 [Brevibacillus sp. NPDC058079]|uniref:hypothetical protein n=1 Tax=Brevibacillus sp. NPDC058079 TaxID=3346330 RepID=UPI0036EB3272